MSEFRIWSSFIAWLLLPSRSMGNSMAAYLAQSANAPWLRCSSYHVESVRRVWRAIPSAVCGSSLSSTRPIGSFVRLRAKLCRFSQGSKLFFAPSARRGPILFDRLAITMVIWSANKQPPAASSIKNIPTTPLRLIASP
jgi:hypothetical protein